ncbi:MAG: YbaY family lipoprotein [Cyanobacteria bacterium]|nr:YbaY family lipoprotein [Cyanobacteriota bacterium]
MRPLRSITITITITSASASASARARATATAAAAAAGLVALVMPLPAHAGSLSGTAAYRERIALPPDAVFEAVLIDTAIADAPARELGRVRLQPAGQPPFRFTIPYRDGDLTPAGRYAVRATVRQGERLLFTTDTFTPVLGGGPSQPLSLKLVGVQTGRLLPSLPIGRLPASWRGDLAVAGGRTRWQVDLLADGSFQLRQTFLDRPAPNRFDDIGRWRIEPGSNRLVLRGGREAPLFFQPLEGGAALAKLDLQGEPIRSRQPDRLQRLATPQPIDPRLHLAGMFRYLADAATIRLCATGARLPVAMEVDYRRLERAYLKAQPADRRGQPLLVNLEGLITSRPSAEPGQPPQRTLVVERFLGVHPGQGCPQPNTSPNASSAPASRPMAPLSLRGTLWRLQALQDSRGPTLFKPPGPAPELLLAVDQERVSGTDGCIQAVPCKGSAAWGS